MTDARTVSVVFVDAQTGQPFARSEVPGEQLPESFVSETTMHLGDEPWQVERAQPATALEFLASGQLTLVLRRVELVDPATVNFSMPSICDSVPEIDPHAPNDKRLEMNSDDWRQIELVSASQLAVVETELQAIQRIYEQHTQAEGGFQNGFRNLHVRTRPIAPLDEPLPIAELWQCLVADHVYRGVGFHGSPGVAMASFAWRSGSVSVYGLGQDDVATVVGLHDAGGSDSVSSSDPGVGQEQMARFTAGLRTIMLSFDLVLVDWCGLFLVEPDDVDAYFHV